MASAAKEVLPSIGPAGRNAPQAASAAWLDNRAAPEIAVEAVGLQAMSGFEPAWSDLLCRALEPNVFLDPAFAFPLFQHVRYARRPSFLLAWETDGPASFGRLVGLLPVHLPRSLWGLARGYYHPQVTTGLPLLDRDRGVQAFAAMTAWLARHHPRLSGLVLTDIPVEGEFRSALAGPVLRHLGVYSLGERQRAVLQHGETETPRSLKHRKELRRQRRRLEHSGELAFRSARTPAQIRVAAEMFLALEARGWKGRRGTALLRDPTLATFLRAMTRLMAHDGRCRIDSLEISGVPVAMGIVLTGGTRAHFWKTTYDERFAALSPGVHLTLELTQLQEEAGLTLTDSCAVPDHPMINRIWRGRMALADIAIALPDRSPVDWGFRGAVGLELLRRNLRRTLGTIYRAALRWRGRSR